MAAAGSILIIIGAAAIRSEQPGFDMLLIGLALFFLGFIFWNRWRSKERRSTRFSKFRIKPEREMKKERKADNRWEDPFDE
mgnify:FL=1